MSFNISKTKIVVGGVSSQEADRTVRWPREKGWAVTCYGAPSI